jgi:hypothetical protein
MLTMKRMVGPLSLAAAACLLAVGTAQAATTVDKGAAILVYPKIVTNTEPRTDTIIEIANLNPTLVANLHCFYVNATSHCTNTGAPCLSSIDCNGGGACLPSWAEVDFSVNLTRNQPFYWLASTGRNRTCANNGTCEPLPLNTTGICLAPAGSIGQPCVSNAGCGAGGSCSVNPGTTNAGTAIPPVPESLFFIGELKCVITAADGSPINRNDLIGTATLVTDLGEGVIDAQSYKAVGIRGISRCDGNPDRICDSDADCNGDGPCIPVQDGDNVLRLGNDANLEAEYQGCAETLILDHIFDGAPDPVGEGIWVTDLTLVPCSENFALGQALLGRSTAQFLVYNEFEQRFSSSRPVTCFDETLLSNIDTRNNARSIFSVNVSGTVAGQSRIRAVGDGLLGTARAMKVYETDLDGIAEAVANGLPPVFGPGAGYDLHQDGQRAGEDRIVLP